MSSENQSPATDSKSAVATTADKTVARPSGRKTFQELIATDDFRIKIGAALPKHLTPDRFVRVLMNATMKNPKILECTQESLFKGIFDAAAVGLEIDGRRAHLVPLVNRKKPGSPLEANLWLDYKGVAELVMRSGQVSNIHADVVCENDVFEYDRGELKRHSIDFKKPRGEMYAAYCIIRMKDGGEKVEVMGKEDIDRVRNASPGKDGDPWRLHYNEQAKKTVFKRASKWVPLSPENRDVIEADNDAIDIGHSPASVVARAEPLNPFQLPEPAAAEQMPGDPVADKRGPAVTKKSVRASAPAEVVVEAAPSPEPPPVAVEPAKAEAGDAPAKHEPRAFVTDGEIIEVTCRVKDVTPFSAKIGDVLTPSVQVNVSGEFFGTVFHIGGATAEGDKLTPLPVWKAGADVKLKLRGKHSERLKKVQVVVDAVEAVPEEF